MLMLSIPSGHGYELINIDVLSEIVACKNIVEAQGAIAEIIAETLGVDCRKRKR
jgi:hypothetical protein